MLCVTLTVLQLSYPSRPAITRLGWGWRTERPTTGVKTALHGHMTSRSASTLPLLPWECCHEASFTPRADHCGATGTLTASRYCMAAGSLHSPRRVLSRSVAGMYDLVLIKEHDDNGMIATRRRVGSASMPAAPDDKPISHCALLLTSGPRRRVVISNAKARSASRQAKILASIIRQSARCLLQPSRGLARAARGEMHCRPRSRC